MKRLLVILFLLSAFLFYSYADDWSLWPYRFSYNPYYSPIWQDDYCYSDYSYGGYGYYGGYDYYRDYGYYNRGGLGTVVILQPPSALESFLYGFGRGITRSMDYYYRRKEQEQYTKTMMALLELKWASDGKSTFNSNKNYQGWKFYLRDSYDPPPVSKEEIETHRKRIKELDRIIERKEERAKLDKLFREAGWLDKDRIEYLDKHYPLPKEEPRLVEGFLGSKRWVSPQEYKAKKLNEYLKSQGLPPVPENVDVNRVFDGDWVIYWDGDKWVKKKKDE